MYVRHVKIDTNLCDADVTGCQMCKNIEPHVFDVQSGQKATVKAPFNNDTPINFPDWEVNAGHAIGNCPKAAIWGRGEGEGLRNPH